MTISATTRTSIETVCQAILSFFLPPAAVAWKCGFIRKRHFFINLALTIMGWIPGVIHALYIVFFWEAPPVVNHGHTRV